MAYFNKRTEVTRSTWCFKKSSRVDVRLMAPGQVPPQGVAEMLLRVDWRGEIKDAKLTVLLKARDGGSGDIRFARADGPSALIFPSNRSVYRVVKLYGQTATTGAAPDVDLLVDIDGERNSAGRLAVQGSSGRLDIRDQAGNAAPPAAIKPGDQLRLKAVLSTAAVGTYNWLTIRPGALRIVGSKTSDSVRLQALRPAKAYRNQRLVGVHFKPQGGGPARVAVYKFAVQFSGKVIDRSVVPDRPGVAASQLPMAAGTAYEIRRLDGTVAATGTLGAQGDYSQVLPAGQVYQLVVRDHQGLAI